MADLRPPNILFLFTDSWDGRKVGYMGEPALRGLTPNMDRLAAGGTVFRQTYTSHPICCPARANVWSGQYTHHCESWNNHKGLEPGTPTFKDRLEREAGYTFATELGGFGKHDYLSGHHTHLARVSAWTGPANLPLPVYRSAPPVVLDSREPRRHSDWRKADDACAFLETRVDADQPFFCYVGFGLPHPKFRTNRHWFDKVDLDAVDIPPDHAHDHPALRYQRRHKNWSEGFDEQMVRQTRAVYYAMIAEVDAAIGRVIDKLRELGLDDNTIILAASDHGEMALEHRDWYKMSMFESSVRVPLVVAGPGVRAGAVVDAPVSLIDLHPTFTELAGLDPSPDADGRSLVPLLRDADAGHRPWALATFTGSTLNTSAYMLRQGPWKYIAYVGYPPQLFNLDEDPDELDDRAASEPDRAAQMDRSLRDIVDYEQVHARLIEYDKAAFRAWRQRARAGEFATEEYGHEGNPLTTYQQIMANIYLGFGPEHEARLEAWLHDHPPKT